MTLENITEHQTTDTDIRILEDQEGVDNLINHLAQLIMAKRSDFSNVVLIGILSKGYPLALRIQKQIQQQLSIKIPIGKLDTALYRDDILTRKGFISVQESDIPFEISGKDIILVDDVLYEGRTLRAALNGLNDFGRPNSIEFAVLINRNQTKLPLHANYVGKEHSPKENEYIQVNFLEIGGTQDEVLITPIPE